MRSLRKKGYVEMDVSPDDRRKMDIRCTPEGRRVFEKKYKNLLSCVDRYVDVLGEEDILELTDLLRRAADSDVRLFGAGKNN